MSQKSDPESRHVLEDFLEWFCHPATLKIKPKRLKGSQIQQLCVFRFCTDFGLNFDRFGIQNDSIWASKTCPKSCSDFRHVLGSILSHFGSQNGAQNRAKPLFLAYFYLFLLTSLWDPFLSTFGSLWLHFWPLWGHFCSKMDSI